MIYLKLFLVFLEIGTIAFGGGYGIISITREKVLAYEWLSESEILNFIAISESTPGPIAVNLATFVGAEQGGFLGSLVATLGVVLPAFIIIILIYVFMRNFLKYKPVDAFFSGVRPCVVAVVISTSITMLLSNVFNFTSIKSNIKIDWLGLLILAIIIATSLVYKKIKHKKISPIFIIALSAVCGIALY